MTYEWLGSQETGIGGGVLGGVGSPPNWARGWSCQSWHLITRPRKVLREAKIKKVQILGICPKSWVPPSPPPMYSLWLDSKINAAHLLARIDFLLEHLRVCKFTIWDYACFSQIQCKMTVFGYKSYGMHILKGSYHVGKTFDMLKLTVWWFQIIFGFFRIPPLTP